MNKLKTFKISKLHGTKTYTLKFKDNTLIMVGENGAGKTTILRILYYTLSGQWSSLAKFEFESVSIKIDTTTITIKKSELFNHFDFSNNKILRHFPPPIRRKVQQIMDDRDTAGISLTELEYLCDQYGVNFNYFLREIDLIDDDLFPEKKENLNNKHEAIKKALNSTQLLYLPTYRRIEHELSSIFKGLDENELRHRGRNIRYRKQTNHTELIEFGMKDVDKAIDMTLENLKDFARENLNSLTLGYLGDVVDKKYLEVDVAQIKAASDETIKNILKRIASNILSEDSKKHLSETIENVKKDEKLSEHAQVICHYFIKLLNFQQELEKKESRMRNFCEVCNAYMEDKVFTYISASFSFAILPKGSTNLDDDIKPEQLSSGEKQIVSLFSHLYLSDENQYFVLIDEPELSLSVPWQRRFLVDIRAGSFCTGLLAVTHSPFIYDNELDIHAHGLGEFIKEEA